MSKPVVSFASLNATKACEVPRPVPYIDENGEETDLVLLILGDDSETVRKASNALTDAHRRQQAIREERARKIDEALTPGSAMDDLGYKLSAVRLVGWEGMDLDYTPELALELCKSNSHIATTVTREAKLVGKWLQASPKA